MERKLFRYIWTHSRREQFTVLAIVLMSLPFYFWVLNLPKLIVNGPIQGGGFESEAATETYFHLAVPLPGFLADWFGQALTLFGGIELGRVDALYALSLMFLALVCVNGGFKYHINTMKGRMGERMLRRLRYELVDRVLRFPPGHLKRTKASEISSMVKDEVEPLGGFIGEAFATPLFLGGQAATALLFIMLQNLWLGLIAASIVGVQGFIIPRLRRPILKLGKLRQLQARELAGRVGEIVDGAADIHALDTSNWERAEVTKRLGRIYDIRFEIYQRKYFVKFLNNFLAQVTPFIFYLVGGWFAIHGELSIGQLLAVIAAYKDLPAPIKDLIDWDLQRQDVQIKYEQVIDQFHPDGMIDAALQAPIEGPPPPLSGEIVASSVSAADESGARLLDGVSFSFGIGEHVAFAGPLGGGKEAAAALIARQLLPRGGAITIGDSNLADLPEAVTGRRIGYAGQDAFFFPLTIRENLLYGLKHEPKRAAVRDAAQQRAAEARMFETLRAGNAPFDCEDDWIDYERLCCDGPAGIDAKLFEVLDISGLTREIFSFGLQGRIDPDNAPELADRILAARQSLKQKLEEDKLTDLVEPFDETKFNAQATIAENLLFGTPIGPVFRTGVLADNAFVREILRLADLETPLAAMGREIAETMVELFRDLPPDHPFFAQYSFIAAADLPAYQAMLSRARGSGGFLGFGDRQKLLTLAFSYSDARHRLGLAGEDVRKRILKARALFAAQLPGEFRDAIAFYDPEAFNEAATVEDNILFGRVAFGAPNARERVQQLIDDAVGAMGLRPQILRIGLDFHTGTGGKRLAPAQRQRLALARALLGDPDLLVVNGALAVLDPQSQADVLTRLMKARPGRGLVWTTTSRIDGEHFTRVIHFEGGRVANDTARSETRQAAQ